MSRSLKMIAKDLKEALDIHSLAYNKGWAPIYKACNSVIDSLGNEAMFTYMEEFPEHKEFCFWKMFPNGNSSILKFLENEDGVQTTASGPDGPKDVSR